VPSKRTSRPGMNFSVAGFGVASVWMNMMPHFDFDTPTGAPPAMVLEGF
jgi:hypothetical protein